MVPCVENLSDPLNTIHFKDGYGWAVGNNGLILKTEDGSTWIDQNTGQKYPSKYHLFQNYPNPFNPTTTIILGQKVATLVDKKQLAGKYNAKWNASDMASGLYYYRLKTNKECLTRKLLLLK